MSKTQKYDMILDALQSLLEQKDIQTISVSEIAQTAGIGKGSIYYYFPSKDAMLEALVERSYEKPLLTAKHLADQTEISPFTRMAMIFQACHSSSLEFRKSDHTSSAANAPENAYIHQKFLNHLITELKPTLTRIISQGIEAGLIDFDNPEALSEIALIVLAVKIDNTLVPSTPEEIHQTIQGLVSLMERGTGNPEGTLNFLKIL